MEILIVDDEKAIQPLFTQFFRAEIKNNDFIFHFAFTANEALTYLEENKGIHALFILADINMPGINGLELLRIVKMKYAHILVFIVTAYGDEKNYKLAVSYGADDFVTKPIDFQELKRKMLQLKQDSERQHE